MSRRFARFAWTVAFLVSAIFVVSRGMPSPHGGESVGLPPVYSIVFSGSAPPEMNVEIPSTTTDASAGWQPMRHPNGSMYLCYIPSVANSGEWVGGEQGDQQRPSTGKVFPTPSYNELQKSLGPRPLCAVKTAGWWTYEVCWERSVRQYHVDGAGQQATLSKEFYLGKGPHMKIEDGASFELSYHIHDTRGPYVSAVYYNGTECDLTHQQRETEVRLYCSSSAPKDLVEGIEVSEPETCKYLVEWWSAAACTDPLKKEEGPSLSITCYLTSG